MKSGCKLIYRKNICLMAVLFVLTMILMVLLASCTEGSVVSPGKASANLKSTEPGASATEHITQETIPETESSYTAGTFSTEVSSGEVETTDIYAPTDSAAVVSSGISTGSSSESPGTGVSPARTSSNGSITITSPRVSSTTAKSKETSPIVPPTSPPGATTIVPPRENDIGKLMQKENFAITVHTVNKSAGKYEVTLTLTYTGSGTHALNAKERFFVANAAKERITLIDIYNESGSSLLGTSIVSGESIKIRAVYDMPNEFVPDNFRYVYDINGFRYIHVII